MFQYIGIHFNIGLFRSLYRNRCKIIGIGIESKMSYRYSPTFQRFMDKIFRDLSYVTIYLDDILVHSPDEETHKAHLLEVFNRLAAAGVTLRGKKCRIGMSSVT